MRGMIEMAQVTHRSEFPSLRHGAHVDLVLGADRMGFLAVRCPEIHHRDVIGREVGGGEIGSDRWVHPSSIVEGRVYDFR